MSGALSPLRPELQCSVQQRETGARLHTNKGNSDSSQKWLAERTSVDRLGERGGDGVTSLLAAVAVFFLRLSLRTLASEIGIDRALCCAAADASALPRQRVECSRHAGADGAPTGNSGHRAGERRRFSRARCLRSVWTGADGDLPLGPVEIDCVMECGSWSSADGSEWCRPKRALRLPSLDSTCDRCV